MEAPVRVVAVSAQMHIPRHKWLQPLGIGVVTMSQYTLSAFGVQVSDSPFRLSADTQDGVGASSTHASLVSEYCVPFGHVPPSSTENPMQP